MKPIWHLARSSQRARRPIDLCLRTASLPVLDPSGNCQMMFGKSLQSAPGLVGIKEIRACSRWSRSRATWPVTNFANAWSASFQRSNFWKCVCASLLYGRRSSEAPLLILGRSDSASPAVMFRKGAELFHHVQLEMTWEPTLSCRIDLEKIIFITQRWRCR